jgi:O-antigen/teichoic acid export membrane protein
MHALIFFYFFAVLMFVVCHQSSRSRNYWPWFLIFPCILSDLFLVCNQTLFRKYQRMNTKIYCTKVYDLGEFSSATFCPCSSLPDGGGQISSPPA